MALLMSSGMHFGGVLGGGGLAIVAAGCAFLQTQQASVVWSMPASATNSLAAEPEIVQGVTDAPVPLTTTLTPRADTSLAAEPDILPASGPPTLAPAPSPQPERPGPKAETIGPVQPATFIVKFRENAAIDTVVANWRSDREAAKAAFTDWAEGDPIFAQMNVVGCSYSGELVLEAPVPVSPASARSRVREMIEQIRGHSAVAYADPDFTAQPGLAENR